MKIKTSMKHVQAIADIVFRCGYCDLYEIMYRHDPQYYNCGVYGWNCDIYTDYIDGKCIAITTGYRNMRGKEIPAETIKKYSDIAKSIRENHYNNHDYSKAAYNEMCEKLENNVQEFLRELIA